MGVQCSISSCCQLDFLPVKCAHCSRTFCKDHSSPLHHECQAVPLNNVSAEQIAASSPESFQCSYEACTIRDVVELSCTKCGQHFCVSHRHHGCMDARREAQRARREKFEAPKRQFKEAKEAVDKMLDAKIEKNRNLSGTKKDTANKIQLMRLKQKATGRRNIPVSQRSYFLVHWVPAGTSEPDNKPVFVNKEWPTGRVVDEVADQCKIIRDTNPSAPKLRLFQMTGEILTEDMSIPLQKLLDESVLIDGASLIIDQYVPSEDGDTTNHSST